MDNEKDLLTATELASMVQCSVKTIKHKTANRQIPAVRFGRSWVYPRQAVIEALNEAARREADEQNRQIFIVPRGRGKRVRPVFI